MFALPPPAVMAHSALGSTGRTRRLVLLSASLILCTGLPWNLVMASEPHAAAEQAALEVLTRVAGQPVAVQFHYQPQAANPSAVSHPQLTVPTPSAKAAWYQTEVRQGVLHVRGNQVSAMTYGAYQALQQAGQLSVNWEGSRVALQSPLPAAPQQQQQSFFTQRAYLNVCAYGYSTVWWDWSRWQQELDWMALRGINNPVAMEGQEFIWQQLWREFGLRDSDLQDYFSGPAFLPWQRMGNIEGYQGPLPASFIEKKRQLQHQLLGRMQQLQMQPVVPAFSGYVPKALSRLYPTAKIKAMKPWSGFAEGSHWLDPQDPLFNKIAKRFIELYQKEYGQQRYFLLDPFNEMLPPVSAEHKQQELTRYGKALYQSIAQAAPEAVWVMQGWMFGSDAHFWDLPAIAAFLAQVPNDKLLIHDIGNDRFDVWQKADSFYGKSWVFGFIHNYGGSNPVYGDFDFYREKLQDVFQHPHHGALQGFGAFPEGIQSNSLVYNFIYDLAWHDAQTPSAAWRSTPEWLAQQLGARYGLSANTPDSQRVLTQWLHLYKAVYSSKYWEPRWWEDSAGASLLQKRPTLEYLRYSGAPGNLTLLDQTLQKIIAMPRDSLQAPLLQYDLIDLARHSATQHIDMLLQHTMLAYSQGQVARGDALAQQAKQLIFSTDALMAYQPKGTTRESLYSWLKDARAYGTTAEEAALYERNARLQVTTWGGNKLKDYASKAWHGMYAQFYWPRWQLFFQLQRQAAVAGQSLDKAAAEAQLQAFEANWQQAPLTQPQAAPSDLLQAITELQQQIKASKAPPSNL